MKVRNANLGRSEILGRPSERPEVGLADVAAWRWRLGALSAIAGAAAVIAAVPTAAEAKDKEFSVPPRIAQKGAELVKKLNGACSKPDLLRRQSEYRLPGQKGEFNMVNLLAGADDCPGAPIPPGNYTAASPFTDTGTTVGANNTVTTIPAACNGFYTQVAGPDHIYSFQISGRGPNPQITATTTSPTYDLSIYILNGATGIMCPAGTGNVSNNCIVGADSTFNGSPEVIDPTGMNQLPLNTPLYLFIDSFYSAGGASAGPYTVTMQDVTVPGAGPVSDAPLDMNGDGKTDYVTLRNVGGGASGQVRWYTSFQDGFPTSTTDWGIASDQFVPADYDGDGKTDFAVFRPGAQGIFYIVRSATMTMFSEEFGINGDDASVVGDYTGNGRADLAVYRAGATPSDPSTWFYRQIGSPPGVQSVVWGQGGDTPAPGDYNGDGKYDFVVQRPDSNGVNGRFWVKNSSGQIYSEWFGLANDSIVPGDYDNDGKTDLAVARNDNGQWRWEYRPSGGGPDVSDTWGVFATDIIAQGDYNGDGGTEFTVWRPGNPGIFFTMTPVTRIIFSRPWGATGDVPAANFNEH